MTLSHEHGCSTDFWNTWTISGCADGPLHQRPVWWPLARGLADRAAAEAWLRRSWRAHEGFVHFSIHRGPETGTAATRECWEHWSHYRRDGGELELRSGRDGREV
jgi:hypothetical protein